MATDYCYYIFLIYLVLSRFEKLHLKMTVCIGIKNKKGCPVSQTAF